MSVSYSFMSVSDQIIRRRDLTKFSSTLHMSFLFDPCLLSSAIPPRLRSNISKCFEASVCI